MYRNNLCGVYMFQLGGKGFSWADVVTIGNCNENRRPNFCQKVGIWSSRLTMYIQKQVGQQERSEYPLKFSQISRKVPF